jgi:hypothetical protein
MPIHDYTRIYVYVQRCNVTHAGMRAHTRTRSKVQLVSFHTRMCKHARAQTHTRARWQPDRHSHVHVHTHACTHTLVRARAQTRRHTRTHAHTHIPTYTCQRLALAVCARARSAAGRRRSITPLEKGTWRWWRRCSRAVPTCTRRTSGGAAAGLFFGACACARACTHTRTHITHARVSARTNTRTHTRARTHIRAYTRRRARAGGGCASAVRPQVHAALCGRSVRARGRGGGAARARRRRAREEQ